MKYISDVNNYRIDCCNAGNSIFFVQTTDRAKFSIKVTHDDFQSVQLIQEVNAETLLTHSAGHISGTSVRILASGTSIYIVAIVRYYNSNEGYLHEVITIEFSSNNITSRTTRHSVVKPGGSGASYTIYSVAVNSMSNEIWVLAQDTSVNAVLYHLSHSRVLTHIKTYSSVFNARLALAENSVYVFLSGSSTLTTETGLDLRILKHNTPTSDTTIATVSNVGAESYTPIVFDNKVYFSYFKPTTKEYLVNTITGTTLGTPKTVFVATESNQISNQTFLTNVRGELCFFRRRGGATGAEKVYTLYGENFVHRYTLPAFTSTSGYFRYNCPYSNGVILFAGRILVDGKGEEGIIGRRVYYNQFIVSHDGVNKNVRGVYVSDGTTIKQVDLFLSDGTSLKAKT